VSDAATPVPTADPAPDGSPPPTVAPSTVAPSTAHRDQLRLLHGGSGQRTLLLLHGLGATADVWRGVGGALDRLGADAPRWIAPDLPGHGGSAPLRHYGTGTLAAALAAVLDPTDEVTVVGHSLGGVIGLTLATGWYGVTVREVVAVGVKVAWTEDELARMWAQAAKAPRRFATRDEAVERYLRTSGLAGLVDPADPAVDAGVVDDADGPTPWRLALDQRAYGLVPPDMGRLLAAVPPTTRVVLARGEHDAMVSDADLAALVDDPRTLPGLGHNAQVDDPAAVLSLTRPPAA
jgi:pimeloyl-ACP methyl ester carboxylesterase